MSISLKEAGETEYWLELLRETEYIDKNQAKELLNDVKEIIKILNAILKTTRREN